MIRLPPFRVHEPTTIAEAVALLADAGADAAVVGGGTGLFPNMKRRTVTPTEVVSLRGITAIAGIDRRPDGSGTVGALTTLAALAAHDDWALGRAAAEVASPQIREVATVGGNLCLEVRCNFYDMSEEWRDAVGSCLKAGGDICQVAPRSDRCWAVVSSDLAPVGTALNATIHLAGPDGAREVSFDDFYINDGLAHLDLRPGEFVTHVEVPPTDRAGYRKVRRRGSIDFPILGVAAALRVDEDGTCTSARIALGAIAPHPVRAEAAEEHLVGKRLDTETIEEAGELTAKAARPTDNTDLTPRYRRQVVAVTTRRLLAELAG